MDIWLDSDSIHCDKERGKRSRFGGDGGFCFGYVGFRRPVRHPVNHWQSGSEV